MPRRKPHTPTLPPEWVETPAQMAGTQVEPVKTGRDVQKLRRFRVHVLEKMRDSNKISFRQCQAGLAIHEAWCETQLSPPAVREINVDSTPKPDDVTVAQCERMKIFADLMALVPSDMTGVVRHVCCEGLPIRNGLAKNGPSASSLTASLQVALDLVANHKGY